MNHFEFHAAKQRAMNLGFKFIALAGLLFAVGILLLLLLNIIHDGLLRINTQFITSYTSRHADKAGIVAGLVGTFYMVLLTTLIAVPVGIGAAVYLEEYGRKNRLARLIEINIANLPGVPSIVYGLLG